MKKIKWVRFKGKQIARLPNSTFNEIKLPKGTKLINISQAIDLLNEEKTLVKLGFTKDDSFFFEQPLKKNKEKGYTAVTWPCGLGGVDCDGIDGLVVDYGFVSGGRAREVIITK